MPDRQWRWTPKGPALIIGTVLTMLGGFLLVNGRWRYSLPVGAALIGAGLATVVYSTTVHGWCAPTGAVAFGKEWGSGFWHGPSVWDCWHLVNPYTPKGR